MVLAGTTVLVALPALLPGGLLNASIQMLIAALFACAYSLLAGRAGMLSFGHAAYFGVGAFATVHAMNAVGGAGLLPTPLLPLAGAVAGLGVGLVAGWFATQRTGITFAMITLAIAELLHALAPQLKGWFGGESGVSAMRMPAWGLTFGSTTEVYYLTLAWVLASVGLLYFHTSTPMGRLALALRENGHRLRFLGYDVHGLGVAIFAISAMFSGIAGGLLVVSNEAANYVVFDPGLSASVVLNTFIGGVGSFMGPAFGAALMTFFSYAVSDLTRSWLLYQGVLFVLVMMFMPSGVAGLIAATGRLVGRHGYAAIAPVAVLVVIAATLLSAGSAFVIEILQHFFSQDYRSLARMSGRGSAILLFGHAWAPAAVSTWVWPAGLLAAGAALAAVARRRLAALDRDPRPDKPGAAAQADAEQGVP